MKRPHVIYSQEFSSNVNVRTSATDVQNKSYATLSHKTNLKICVFLEEAPFCFPSFPLFFFAPSVRFCHKTSVYHYRPLSPETSPLPPRSLHFLTPPPCCTRSSPLPLPIPSHILSPRPLAHLLTT